MAQYDVVLDCTDSPAARYLVSDACVLARRPLVSASALQTSGQLFVLNSPPSAAPCYRCLFPRPPPPAAAVACGEGGILGPVVGAMGVLQALEAIKIAAGVARPRDGPSFSSSSSPPPPAMLLFSALGGDGGGPSFRSVRLRPRRPDCFACSPRGGLTPECLRLYLDYRQFCGAAAPVSLLPAEGRVSVDEYCRVRTARPDHVLLDVREREHFSLGSIPGAVNVPASRFHRGEGLPDGLVPDAAPVYVVCRVGNDSQVVARKLRDAGLDRDGTRFIGDIRGGLRAWRDAVDPTMPFV